MAKTKKLTAKNILASIGYQKAENKNNVILLGAGDNVAEIPVKTRLTVTEEIRLVNNVEEMVLNEDDHENVTYIPSVLDFAFEYELIGAFTDIQLPATLDEAVEFINETGLVEKIKEVAGEKYVEKLYRATCDYIDFKKQIVLKHSKLDDVINAIIDFLTTLSGELSTLDVPALMDMMQEKFPELKGLIEQAGQAQELPA